MHEISGGMRGLIVSSTEMLELGILPEHQDEMLAHTP